MVHVLRHLSVSLALCACAPFSATTDLEPEEANDNLDPLSSPGAYKSPIDGVIVQGCHGSTGNALDVTSQSPNFMTCPACTSPGAPIVAANRGKAWIAGDYNGCCSTASGCGAVANNVNGRYVRVDHPDGFSTHYLHLATIAITNGQEVQSGQILGFEGCTGYTSSGSPSAPYFRHLHFFGTWGDVDGDGKVTCNAAGSLSTSDDLYEAPPPLVGDCSSQYSTNGSVRAKWLSLGGCSSFLGAPVMNQAGTPDGRGDFAQFSSAPPFAAWIYATPSTGAHEIHGAIGAHWAALGWETSWLGWPVSDEYQYDGSPWGMPGWVAESEFEHGWLSYAFEDGRIYEWQK